MKGRLILLAALLCPQKTEEVHVQLIAFYPVVTDQGIITRVIYKLNESKMVANLEDYRQVESVKRALARCYAVDLPAQASLLREKYGRRILLHFYLPDGCTENKVLGATTFYIMTNY